MTKTAWERAAAFTWKQGDTAPAIVEQLLDGNGNPVDLTSASVKFLAWIKGDAAVKINAAATIVTPAEGIVSFTPTSTHTDTIGPMLVEWQVTFGGGGGIETFRNSAWQRVEVVPDLGA